MCEVRKWPLVKEKRDESGCTVNRGEMVSNSYVPLLVEMQRKDDLFINLKNHTAMLKLQ